MIRKADEVNKQMAELEYKNYEINELIKTEQGFKVVSLMLTIIEVEMENKYTS